MANEIGYQPRDSLCLKMQSVCGGRVVGRDVCLRSHHTDICMCITRLPPALARPLEARRVGWYVKFSFWN